MPVLLLRLIVFWTSPWGTSDGIWSGPYSTGRGYVLPYIDSVSSRHPVPHGTKHGHVLCGASVSPQSTTITQTSHHGFEEAKRDHDEFRRRIPWREFVIGPLTEGKTTFCTHGGFDPSRRKRVPATPKPKPPKAVKGEVMVAAPYGFYRHCARKPGQDLSRNCRTEHSEYPGPETPDSIIFTRLVGR